MLWKQSVSYLLGVNDWAPLSARDPMLWVEKEFQFKEKHIMAEKTSHPFVIRGRVSGRAPVSVEADGTLLIGERTATRNEEAHRTPLRTAEQKAEEKQEVTCGSYLQASELLERLAKTGGYGIVKVDYSDGYRSFKVVQTRPGKGFDLRRM
jgi:hypothetical protein